MKNILILFLTISLLSSCDKTKRETTQTDLEIETEKKQDTIYNYWELSPDTISYHKKFKILNKDYSLDLKTFSLNDSLIVRNLGQERDQVYLDYSHTMVTDLALLTDSIVDKKRIDRTDFKQALNQEFYKECNLFSTTIDSIVGNTFYLTSDLAVPDTDNQWRIWYSIKVTNNRLGNIEIKETNYVGL
tara:strand:- start:5402 stop:5965 length:564 start_codon:yes stop_codon:yes gene_type:complete